MKTQIFFLVRIKAFFGKSEFPYEYNILSKCLEHKSQMIVHGITKINVDDLVAFSLNTYAESDQEKLKLLHTNLFGSTGLNVTKSKAIPSVQGDFIGWFWDLAAGTVRPKKAAIDKLKVTLFVIIDNTAEFWSLRQVQVLVCFSYYTL